MKTHVIRSLALLAALCPLVVRAVTPPPANDTFAKATVLSGPVQTLNNQTCAGATSDALDPYVGTVKMTKTVWYRFDAVAATKNAHVVIAHPFGGVVAAVFFQSEPDGGAGTLLATTNGTLTNTGTGTDTITFQVGAQNRYYLCVQAPAGLFNLTLMLPGQNNDFFQDATAISGNKGTVKGSNEGCSNVGDTPGTPVSGGPANGVWYTWTTPFTGAAVVDTNFSYLASHTLHSTSIAVFTGNSLASLSLVAKDQSSGYSNGGGYGSNSRVTFNATFGTTYTIWVGDSFTASGAFNLEYFQNTEPGEFELVAEVTQLSPATGPVTAEIRRHYAGAPAVGVTAKTFVDTAIAGTDFVVVNSVLSFPAGGTGSSAYSQVVSVNAVPDAQVLDDRDFFLKLLSTTNGSSLQNGVQNVQFDITYNTVVAPGFTTPTLEVSEKAGMLHIPLQRTNNSGQSVVSIAAYQFDGDTAVNHVDYEFTSITFSFAPGQSLGYIDVPIYDNGNADGNRSFDLVLIPHVAGQTVDGTDILRVTIVDDEAPAPAAGRISTTVGELNGVHAVVDVQITATGALTGKLVMERATYTFTGKLSATGLYRVTVGPATASRTLELQLTNSITNSYTVTLTANDIPDSGTTNSAAAATYSAASPCPQAGHYTFADGGLPSPTQDAVATFAVTAAGTATVAGKLFDGTAFTGSGGVNQLVAPGLGVFGSVAVGQTLYNGNGSLALSLVMQPGAVVPYSSLRLVRPASVNLPAGAVTALPGFDGERGSTVASYIPQAAASRALAQWSATSSGTAEFGGAGYTGNPVQNFKVANANKITLTTATLGANPPPHLTLAFNNATGTFTGTLTPPGATKPQAITGVVIQHGSFSYAPGFFLNPVNLSSGGTVLLQ